MKLKLFFVCAAALMLSPLASQQAQASQQGQGEVLHELQHESAEIVRDLLMPDSTQFTAHETLSPPSVIVRCDQRARYEHEFEEFIDDIEGHSTDWERHRSNRDRSTIREILRDRASASSSSSSSSHSLRIEIDGQCDDIQLQVEMPSSPSHPPQPLPYPNQGQPPSIEQYMEWYEDQMMEENIPWIIRPGSGWHWLLRDQPVEGLHQHQGTP